MDGNIEVSDVRMTLSINENIIRLYIAKGGTPSPRQMYKRGRGIPVDDPPFVEVN